MTTQIFLIIRIVIKALNRKDILSKKDNKEIEAIYSKMRKIDKTVNKNRIKQNKRLKAIKERLDKI